MLTIHPENPEVLLPAGINMSSHVEPDFFLKIYE
jgi:hypothetical protein